MQTCIMEISYDTKLPRTFTSFLQVKKDPDSMLSLSESFSDKGFQSYQMIGSAALFAEAALHRRDKLVSFQVPNQTAIDHVLHDLANATCESNGRQLEESDVFTGFRNWYNCRSTPVCTEFSRSPDVIKNVEQSEQSIIREVFKHLIVDTIRANSCIIRFRYSISEFIQEWIVVIFIVAGFEFELLVFCLATERLEFITVVFR